MRALRLWALGLVCWAAGGCTAAYFHRVAEAPAETRWSLADLPWDEVWMGLVFNGHKIGYSHLELRPAPGASGRYLLCAQTAMRFHFLMLDKAVSLAGCDRVDERLHVERFDYRVEVDRSRMQIHGAVHGAELHVRIRTGDRESQQRLRLEGPLYPASGIDLYPVVHGLQEGAEYTYQVYSAELHELATVHQRVGPWERSELFEVPAWRVHTRMLGQSVTTWIDAQGRPQLEISLNGVLIAGLESERRARRYVLEAALNKQDVLLALSLVPVEPPLVAPRHLRGLDLQLAGLGRLTPPSDAWQKCVPEDHVVRCRIGSLAPRDGGRIPPDPARDLAASLTVPSRDPRIVRLAHRIAGDVQGTEARVARLLEWMAHNIERVAEDTFSALDVLRTRRAECQGHSALFAALARALGIPTRVVNGLVYSEAHQGFLFHTWTTVHLAGRWVPVDPTFAQFPADATHVELLFGEEPAALLPLAGIVGHVRARVLATDPPAPTRPSGDESSVSSGHAAAGAP